MCGLTAKPDGVSLDSKCAKDRAEWKIEIEQDRSLFDVQFDISSGVRQLFARLLHALEIDPVFL